MKPYSSNDTLVQLTENTEQPTSAHTHNQVSPKTLLVAYGVLGLSTLLIMAALYFQTGWSLALTTLISTLGFMVMGIVLFMLATGNWTIWREVVKRYQIQKIAIKTHGDLLFYQETNRHIERVIELSIRDHEVQGQFRLQESQLQLESSKQTLLTTSKGSINPSNFVESNPLRAEATTISLTWLLSLYHATPSGEINTSLVHPDSGRLKKRSPFSNKGSWPEEVSPEVADEAKRILLQPPRGQKPPILPIKNGYALNISEYPTRFAIYRILT